ncbi:MAG: hypothetical protein JWO68_173 [Actinomycetia bacterium]|nr:hypothetical protein [Actinomycetes bacterium]
MSEVALGAMTFGSAWGTFGADDDESLRIMARFGERGGNFIDTADIYTDGRSEALVGRFIADDRDHWVVASKFSGGIGVIQPGTAPADINKAGNHRKNMRRAVEASLRRLGTDHLDVCYLHFWDFTTHPEEVMRTFDDLVSSGKVLYPALSDTPAWLATHATLLAEQHGWAPPVAVQVEYSLLQRAAEREVFPMAKAFDLALAPWAPLKSGLLSGKYASAVTGEPRRRGAHTPTPSEQRVIDVVAEVAGELGCTSAQVAVAWVLTRQDWAPCIPLLGARTLAQLDENLGALDVELEAGHLARLDEVSAIDHGVPGEMLLRGNIPQLSTSGLADQLHNHRGPVAP